MPSDAAAYLVALRAVSDLLYEIDPYEVGSSLDAPRDEYDEIAAWVLEPDLLQQIWVILDEAGLHNACEPFELSISVGSISSKPGG